MNHTVGRSVFALGIGLIVAIFAYQWITDPAPRAQRAAEEQAIYAARELLRDAVGRVYVYAETPGWAISGHYRRDQDDRWHPYLLQLTATHELHALKADDPALDLK
jgi:hypothetical protein